MAPDMSKTHVSPLLRVLLACLLTAGCGSDNKSAAPDKVPTAPAVYGWRGDGTGRFPAATPCTLWGGTDNRNVLWIAAHVGKSFSSPVVAGEVVLLTAEPDKLLCIARKDGKILWERENGVASLPENLKSALDPDLHATEGGFATPTPVTDGHLVYALFGTGVMTCYNLQGKRLWVRVLHADAAPAESGHCASPVLAGGELIVPFGGLVAMDPNTGATLWENRTAEEMCGTPAITKIGDRAVLITAAGDCVNVTDGKTLASGLLGTPANYPSPIVQDGVVYFTGRKVVAVKLLATPAGKFDTNPLWSTDLDGDVFASPVLSDGLLYVVDGAATFYAIDAVNGHLVYKQELDIPTGSSGGIFGSIALAGGHLFLGNPMGNMVVLAPGRQFKLLQANKLDGGEGSSPAFADRQMFLRVNDSLMCIAGK